MTDSPPRGITRRHLAGALTAAPLLAQNAVKTEDDLAASREQVKRNSDQIRRFNLPQATEPGFIFRP